MPPSNVHTSPPAREIRKLVEIIELLHEQNKCGNLDALQEIPEFEENILNNYVLLM